MAKAVAGTTSATRDDRDFLGFDGRYTGVFIAIGDLGPVAELQAPWGVTVSVYASPYISIALVLADEHPEPAIEWLGMAHECCDGSSFLAQLLQTGAVAPNEQHCHLLRIDAEQFDSILARELSATLAFTMRIPFTGEILVLCSEETGRRLCQMRTHLRQNADFGLALVESKSRPARTSGPKVSGNTSYDPVGAQASETLRRASVTFEENLAETKRLLRTIFGKEPPVEIVEVEREIRHLLDAARRNLDQVKADTVSKEIAASSLDLASSLSSDYIERIARLNSLLSAHRDTPDPWSTNVIYSRAAEPHALKALRSVVAELGQRLVPASPSRLVVPVLDNRFSVEPSLLGDLPWKGPTGGTEGRLLVYPSRFSFRAGAFPTAAWLVSSASCDLESVVQDLLDGPLSIAGRQLCVRGADDEETARAFALRARTLLCDLIATTIAGPAYVFALARFTPGTISVRSRVQHNRQPSLQERVSLCVRLLRRLRIRIDFQSTWFDVDQSPISAELAECALERVQSRYDGRRKVLEPAIRGLRRGEVSDLDPSLLLNALWDAVVHRSGYVNEVVLYESITRRDPTPGSYPLVAMDAEQGTSNTH